MSATVAARASRARRAALQARARSSRGEESEPTPFGRRSNSWWARSYPSFPAPKLTMPTIPPTSNPACANGRRNGLRLTGSVPADVLVGFLVLVPLLHVTERFSSSSGPALDSWESSAPRNCLHLGRTARPVTRQGPDRRSVNQSTEKRRLDPRALPMLLDQ